MCLSQFKVDMLPCSPRNREDLGNKRQAQCKVDVSPLF